MKYKMEHVIQQCHGGGLETLHSCLILHSNNDNSYSSSLGFSKALANGCNIQYCWLVRISIKYAAAIRFRIVPYCVDGEGNGNGSIQQAQIS